MKRVHSTDQLMHLFCNMTNQDLEGFKTPSKSVYFENGILYSYGYHYPMAAKYNTGVGQDHREVILVNSNKSSVTTEKHKYKLKQSRKHTQWVFNVPNVREPSAIENTDELLNQLSDVIADIMSGLKFSASLYDSIDNYNRYLKAFKISKPFKLDLDFELILNDLKRQAVDRWSRIDAKNQDIKRKAALQDQKETIDRTYSNLHFWLSSRSHELAPSNRDLDLLCEYLRHDLVKIKNDHTLVTQRGAEVPMTAARTLIKMEPSKLVGLKIGEFSIDDLRGDILSIGCHKISINQVKEVLK